MEMTTNNNTKLVLSIMASYASSISRADDELKRFRSYLRWICVNQSNAMHEMVSWSIFLLLDIFIPTASHFAYNVMVQRSLTSTYDLSYFYLSTFVAMASVASSSSTRCFFFY
ncbi:hypothetical protein B296_00021654 [Ensete ventricosum]|uniref:Uncharacterized protein n=1 Tax=Ensete ventricosum TaxID=4639 RepID=A0A426YJJ0_ENSVE|nr:hypothetical protein B296_00021654 [Ensete ventricosum]